ncbi:unnamed protein product [Rhizoctonia solani]|uniref:Telomerase Cajal body protein 1 n=1 Tax=Rhizoctonia solani TaxID=456999 RepID=A0A8H2WBZ0_9AGAM|nr:unnamed protein product [Rhizoctonia solani]
MLRMNSSPSRLPLNTVDDDDSVVQSAVAAVTQQLTVENLPTTGDKLDHGEPIPNIYNKHLVLATADESTSTPAPVDTFSDPPNPPSLRPHSTLVLSSFSENHNFFRNVHWCMDGTSLLGITEDASLEILDLAKEDDGVVLKHRLSLPQPAPILSTAWFPTASVSEPASFCFAAAIRDTPIKLFDASDGRVRASYRIVDHRERFVAPHCMAFNMYMNRLYCGFEDAIEVFDVHYPGEGTRLNTVPTKKSRDGIRGIISSLAFAPDWSGIYAAGSFGGSIALYTEDTGAQTQSWLEGAEGGITQIRFNPSQAHLVYAAFRRTPRIARWDLRNPSEPDRLYDRGLVSTNQRLSFDTSPDGRWLVAGDERGRILVFDALEEKGLVDALGAHNDSIGAVTFHPTKNYAASISGSRHFEDTPSVTSDSEESEDLEDLKIMVPGTGVRGSAVRHRTTGPTVTDNSLKLWSM